MRKTDRDPEYRGNMDAGISSQVLGFLENDRP